MEKELFSESKKFKDIRLYDFYIPFKKAVEVVKRTQPFADPANPTPEFANDLRKQVSNLLNLKDNDKKLKFYTAVGSHLDRWHKIDAFLELEDDNGKITRVTLDVTINAKKGDEYGADIVFLVPSDGIDKRVNEEEYNKTIQDLSEDIKKYFEFKKTKKP